MQRRYAIILTLLGFFIAPTTFAMIPAELEVDSGRIEGTAGRSPDVRVFKGVPFAMPPVGENRWRPPQPVPPWEGVLPTREFRARCVQSTGGLDTAEDCLYLNIWTTAGSATDRLPVMLWIHGGALTVGSGSEPRYDGEALARRGVIVVTINYRLGPFGFLAHPELSAESPEGVSGNYGFMDALAALRWVRANIAAFGGDPHNVTVFGESAGGRMTGALVGSPAAEGLFERAIMQSGAWMGLTISRMGSLAEAERAGAEAATRLGVNSLAELRTLPAQDIVAQLPSSGIVVDGHLIPEDLSLTFAAGRQNAVDMLLGSNQDEGTFFVTGSVHLADFEQAARGRFGELAETYLSLYPAGSDTEARDASLTSYRDEVAWLKRKIADWHTRAGNKAYLYYFTRVPPAPRPELGSTHVAEIPYVFDHIPAGAPWEDTDRSLANVMASYWVNFAGSGDPNGSSLPAWEAFEEGSPAMQLGETVAPLTHSVPSPEAIEFFLSVFDRVMDE